MTDPPANLPVTPRQCHDARDLLGWNGVELARRAAVEPAALIQFEHRKGALDPDALGRVRSVLEGAGVELTPDGARLRAWRPLPP